jgi:hypothetical protein
MTPKERIQIRDFLNRFSDRWPEEYNAIYHQFNNYSLFQVCILWQLIQMDNTLDAEDIGLIQSLTGTIEQETHPDVKQPKMRTKTTVEEITDGKL